MVRTGLCFFAGGLLVVLGGCDDRASSARQGEAAERDEAETMTAAGGASAAGGTPAAGGAFGTGGMPGSGGEPAPGSGGEPMIVLTPEGLEPGGVYEVASKATGRLLNVSHSSLGEGANVDTWVDTDSDAMRWVVSSLGEGVYTLSNVGSGHSLRVAGEVPAQEVDVDQGPDVESEAVRWIIEQEEDGSYRLRALGNAAVSLDLGGGEDFDGANVRLWENNGFDPQKWIFQRVDEQDGAPTLEIAEQVFSDWKERYYFVDENGGHIANEGFWGVAEMMEMVLDAFEVTGDRQYQSMFEEMYQGFLFDEGTNWMWNDFNDDIMWITIASVRAHLLFGGQNYLDQATFHFAETTARALTETYGGGMIWKEGLTTKNSCINGPTMVAASYLAIATGNSSYIDTAEQIYAWERSHLYDENTGAVWDAFDGPDNINYWSSTYNQGTILGSAVMLYNATGKEQYREDALKIAEYTRYQMYHDDTINWESGRDLEGFKGIFPRYARRFVQDLEQPDYTAWLKENARVSFNNRNTEGLISTLWGTRTPEGAELKAFDAYTAVSIQFNALIE